MRGLKVISEDTSTIKIRENTTSGYPEIVKQPYSKNSPARVQEVFVQHSQAQIPGFVQPKNWI